MVSATTASRLEALFKRRDQQATARYWFAWWPQCDKRGRWHWLEMMTDNRPSLIERMQENVRDIDWAAIFKASMSSSKSDHLSIRRVLGLDVFEKFAPDGPVEIHALDTNHKFSQAFQSINRASRLPPRSKWSFAWLPAMDYRGVWHWLAPYWADASAQFGDLYLDLFIKPEKAIRWIAIDTIRTKSAVFAADLVS